MSDNSNTPCSCNSQICFRDLQKITSQLVVGRSRVEKYLGSCRFFVDILYKGSFKGILVLESEAKGGIWIRWSGFE